MAYIDVNTPVIERITLPSGNTYYIADREIRDVVDALSQIVAGGVKFIMAWDGTATPVVANIPEGVVVKYNDTDYTGTLSPNSAQPGAFYLVKSSTTPSSETLDIYDEYAPIGEQGSKTWEKVGDTKINLSNVVTDVTLNKSTDTVIGTDATFTITQPTIALSTGATAGTGVISVATGISSTSASGDDVTALTGLGSPSTKSAIGADATFTITQPTIALASNSATADGRVQVATGAGTSSSTNTDWLKSVSVSNGTLTIGAATIDTTYLGATASGANTAWNSKDSVAAVTGYASPITDTVLGTGSTITVTPTTTNVAATASGANTAWNNKDSVTVLKSDTSITVTKGN